LIEQKESGVFTMLL